MPNENKSSGREDLRKNFRNGHVPTEKHFSSLIDSMINKQDDGFSIDKENGMMLAAANAIENKGRFFTFYKKKEDRDPFFSMESDDKGLSSLRLTPQPTSDVGETADSKSFFFHSQGSLGIGKKSEEQYKLDVKGFVGMDGRTGTFMRCKCLANGKWHTILDKLDNCQAFEIMARAGKKGGGRFAIIHAIALSTFGKSKNKIRKTEAHYGLYWNKLKLRWVSNSTHNYELQIKTNSNYGSGTFILINVCKLWDDENFTSEGEFYKLIPDLNTH